MHVFLKNLKGTGNFLFNECCFEGKETHSRAVFSPWLNHIYVPSLAREKLMLKKTDLSNNIDNNVFSDKDWKDQWLPFERPGGIICTSMCWCWRVRQCGSLRGRCHPWCVTAGLAGGWRVQHFQNRWVLFVLSRLWHERWTRRSEPAGSCDLNRTFNLTHVMSLREDSAAVFCWQVWRQPWGMMGTLVNC